MAEPVGLAIGVASLATLFESAVTALEYVHFAKSFGADFQTCQLRLDNACLRLSRWGEATGINLVDNSTSSLRDTRLDEANLPNAERLLGGILAEIQRARDMEAKFAAAAEPTKDVHTELSASNLSLHKKMRVMIRHRQHRTPLLDKASWAIRKRARFLDLLDKMVALIDDLEKLFPAASQAGKDLVDKETHELTESLRTLAAITKGQDRVLSAALEKMLKPVEQSYTNNVVGGKQGVGQAFGGTFTQTL